MFLRILLRSALGRRSRTLTALLGITIASAVATTMLNLYVDIESKLTKEFNKFGANILLVAKPGETFSAETLERIRTVLPASDSAIPVAYAVAKTSERKPVVVAGIDIEKMRKLNPWWSIYNDKDSTAIALIGERAAAIFPAGSSSRTLSFKGRAFAVPPSPILHTGGPEDSKIYLALPQFQEWTGIFPSSIEVFAFGSNSDIAALIDQMRKRLPSLEVHPVRQIVETETRVLGKTRAILLAATLMIAIMVALCVLITLSASVLEQRRDFALMKALGSSQRALNTIFISESLALAVAGSIIGFALGCGLAAWIGRANFHAAVVPRLAVFPPVVLGCLLLTVLSAVIPISRLQKLDPAVMLRGD